MVSGRLPSCAGRRRPRWSRPTAEKSFCVVARQFLASDPAAGAGRVARDDSLFTILYHRCPDCRKTYLSTPEGLVEIAGEVVDRIENEAEKVTLAPREDTWTMEMSETAPATAIPIEERDRPNTASIVKKVLLRDGQVCANPMRGTRLGLHPRGER